MPRRLLRPCIRHLLAPNQGGTQETDLAAIESPCILVCSIDMATGYCFGCGRTRDEIGAWLTMTPETRRTVMADLPARLETVERRPRRETRRTRMARERTAGE
jgi:predicted Fe-S protein YdhL (DUF1289 family)